MPVYNHSMQRLQAFKFELMPDGEKQRNMRRFEGACRFVYNKALAMQKANHKAGNKYIGFGGLCKVLTGWRNGVETRWLKDAPCHPLQQALKDLDKAYTNFFAKRADFPRFKKKCSSDSYAIPIRHKSNSIRPTTEFSCRNLAGYATATAVMYWVKCAMSL